MWSILYNISGATAVIFNNCYHMLITYQRCLNIFFVRQPNPASSPQMFLRLVLLSSLAAAVFAGPTLPRAEAAPEPYVESELHSVKRVEAKRSEAAATTHVGSFKHLFHKRSFLVSANKTNGMIIDQATGTIILQKNETATGIPTNKSAPSVSQVDITMDTRKNLIYTLVLTITLISVVYMLDAAHKQPSWVHPICIVSILIMVYVIKSLLFKI